VSQFETVTLDAIGIVALVTFLIGVVFAYLLGVQAQRFGADHLRRRRRRPGDLPRALADPRRGDRRRPLRRRVHGADRLDEGAGGDRRDPYPRLSPIQVLVVPRLVAIMAGLPLLVFVGDLAGIAGGMLIASLQLDISPTAFLARLHTVLPMKALASAGQGAGVRRPSSP
jgi:phospholipid/cholesterol/gamma-HCH transport system permease protein